MYFGEERVPTNRHVLCKNPLINVDIFYNEENNKRYAKKILLCIEDNIFLDDLASIFLFKAELSLFNLNDKQSTYFELRERNITNENVKSLYLKNYKEDIYITKSVAKAIVSLLNIAYNSYNPTFLNSQNVTSDYFH